MKFGRLQLFPKYKLILGDIIVQTFTSDNQQSVWFQIEAQLPKQTIHLLCIETIWWKTQWQIWLQQLPNSTSLPNFSWQCISHLYKDKSPLEHQQMSNLWWKIVRCIICHPEITCDGCPSENRERKKKHKKHTSTNSLK